MHVAAVVLGALLAGGAGGASAAAAPAEPPTRSLSEAEARGVLEADWLYQAGGAPTFALAALEVERARQVAARIAGEAGAPGAVDLSAEVRDLDALGREMERRRAAPARAAPPLPALPAGLLGRWSNADLAGGSYAEAGPAVAAAAAGDYTLCGWIRTTSTEADVIGNGTGVGDFLLMTYRGVTRGHQWTAAGGTVLDGKVRVNDGRWHHVAQVVEGDVLRLFVDGRPDGEARIRGAKVAGGDVATVGSRGVRRYKVFEGDLHDVCAFGRALSGEELGGIVRAGALPAVETDPAAARAYLAVRRVKRRILLKSPEVDFSQVMFIDQPYPAGLEWEHQAKHRLGRLAQQGGRLLVLDGLSPAGTLRKLAPAEAPAAFWRPDLSADARRVVFCMQAAGERSFHLYEVGLDGTGLRQLTNSPYDDLDPIYLPDGHILFSSTRGNTYIRCMPETQAYPLARCDADGRNVYLVSRNNECDWLPALLNDGRVIYSRWEYSDKAVWRIQSLWTVNQDGTGESVFWGNQSVWPDHLAQPQPIPGSRRVMFLGTGHHRWFDGSVGIVDPAAGLNYPAGLTRVTWDVPWAEVGSGPAEAPERADYRPYGRVRAYHSPWPLSERMFLVSAAHGSGGRGAVSAFRSLYLMDVHGNRELVYRGEHNILHAMPVRPRARPAQPDRVAWPGTGEAHRPAAPGVLFSPDVYEGVPDLPRGTVKFLRVIQQDAKTYSTWRPREAYGSHGPGVSAVQIDAVKRVLGTVPVAADGSVAFEVPAGQAVFFQLLDERQRAVHTMRSFTGVMPGEVRGCVGCHEGQTGVMPGGKRPPAPVGKPQKLEPPPWGTGATVSYERFVQPVLDKHCGRCHQGEADPKARKALDLTVRPGLGPFTEPYLTIVGPLRTPWVKCEGQDLAAAIKSEDGNPMTGPDVYRTVRPLARLSPRSRLIELASSGKHYEVKVGGEDLLRLITWVDCNAPFRGEEEIRRIPDVPEKVYANDGPTPPVPPRTRTAPVVDRFDLAQDEVPGRKP